MSADVDADVRAELEDMRARAEQMERTVSLLQSRIRLLEEENARFADMLRDRGVEVRTSSRIALELPPPLATPLSPDSSAMADLSEAERALLRECAGAEPVFFLARTGARVDTGEWFRRGQLCVAALGSDIALFAAGRKPWIDRIPFRFLLQSLYNHVTGELVLAPPRELRVNRLPMPPLEGYQFLAQIYSKKEESNA